MRNTNSKISNRFPRMTGAYTRGKDAPRGNRPRVVYPQACLSIRRAGLDEMVEVGHEKHQLRHLSGAGCGFTRDRFRECSTKAVPITVLLGSTSMRWLEWSMRKTNSESSPSVEREGIKSNGFKDICLKNGSKKT